MGIYTEAIDALRSAIEDKGSIGILSKFSSVPKSSLVRWANGSNKPRFEDISTLLDYLGYRLEKTGEKHIDTSKDSDFVSVPIIKDPSLYRSGYVPPNNISGWCKVERSFASVSSSDCSQIVIEIKDDAMSPTLIPGTLVLIDVDACEGEIESSRMYLVRDPRTGSTNIRRVTVQQGRTDTKIIYSNDNRDDATAQIFSLKKDFHGDLCESIIGRASWARICIKGK